MKKIISLIIVIIVLLVGFYIIENKYGLLEKKNLSSNKTKKKYKEISDGIFKDYYKQAQDMVDEMTIEEKIGQLFLVRYEKNDTTYLNNFYPSGYILFAKDFNNHTKEQMAKELKDLQGISKYPLILGVDEEGGYVTRVSRYPAYRSEKFKSPRDYYLEGGYDLLEQTEKEKAELLKSIGLNLNLAPVADISTNEDDFIYIRTFGEDADKTSEYVTKMVGYANSNKINSTLKHFPGYGNNSDTHTGVAIDKREYSAFEENDYKPFEAGIKANVPSILISHNIVTCLDENTPSSLSSKVIGELRNKLGFTGIIMTDDLAMDAVKEYVDNGKAATMAINAGNDMIITSDFMSMKNELINSVKSKEISEDTINKAVTRVIAWKYYSGLLK